MRLLFCLMMLSFGFASISICQENTGDSPKGFLKTEGGRFVLGYMSGKDEIFLLDTQTGEVCKLEGGAENPKYFRRIPVYRDTTRAAKPEN